MCGEFDDPPGTRRTSFSVPCSPLITELLLIELKLWLLSSCGFELECFRSLCFLCFFELPMVIGRTLVQSRLRAVSSFSNGFELV